MQYYNYRKQSKINLKWFNLSSNKQMKLFELIILDSLHQMKELVLLKHYKWIKMILEMLIRFKQQLTKHNLTNKIHIITK